MTAKIIYTKTDEAPALATYSLLPIVKAFTACADIDVEAKDISLAARILANFSSELNADQQVNDALAELGDLAKTPEANIIKLPNISASIPQLQATIKELQEKGFALPDYNEASAPRYAKVLGSAVNPVLREGNSDRRVAAPVKQYAKDNPHRMGAWQSHSKSHVASMSEGDFYSSEQSIVIEKNDDVTITFTDTQGKSTVLKPSTPLLAGEVIDASTMSISALRAFYRDSITAAKNEDVLLSLHLKATMMKVSDPIMFGHAVTVYYADVFTKHADTFAKIGVNQNNGLGDVYAKIKTLPQVEQDQITADIMAVYENHPALAMVDSDHGITNLHVPSDVIVDASMPATIRSSGQMWGPDGQLKDTKAMIPDRNYSGIYQATIEFCQQHGAFDVTTMGNVANVGLMAKKAEEYGSHDKTFEMTADGDVTVTNQAGDVLMQHSVATGDIWRMCQTKDEAIKDWVKLAVKRARATQNATIFWLDPERAHDKNLINKVNQYLPNHDTAGLEIEILSPMAATHHALARVKAGKDTISVTGNVLRDYLTDLFPILELGTSAKMLSIVPLLAGGGLFETGAGGSAPKHVQQFTEENHLRWDSLGEYLALAVSIEALAEQNNNTKAKVLAETLNEATSQYLRSNKSPSRQVNEQDNRGSSFYLALYWAQALAKQVDDNELQTQFTAIAQQLTDNEEKITEELVLAQGVAIDMGGYYYPDIHRVEAAMRPSATFNGIINQI
ncbi:MAG: NADP-dependent isocitrate dehydrogenase [Thiotrichaceae bacterium]|nr:NADP-dependent isocitrate dehydrogenase [Thiotrichaceae bacterium]